MKINVNKLTDKVSFSFQYNKIKPEMSEIDRKILYFCISRLQQPVYSVFSRTGGTTGIQKDWRLVCHHAKINPPFLWDTASLPSLHHLCLSSALSSARRLSVVHRMLHVHGEDAPAPLRSFRTWYSPVFFGKEGLVTTLAESKNPVLSSTDAEALFSLASSWNDVREKKQKK